MEKRNIRQELMTIGGANFEKWYEGLTREEKLEYSFIIENEKERREAFVKPPQKPDLGEAVHYWIQHKGFLNLDTPEEEIWEFYQNKNENNE